MNTYSTSSFTATHNFLTQGSPHSSISALVADDSKTLGSSKQRSTKRVQEANSFQTSKYQTLNSSWTPLVDQTANKDVFFI